MQSALLLGTGGAIGAVLRYAVSLQLANDRFPFATLVVNIVGSFVLGLVAFAAPAETVVLFIGIGACGSFTTYSSFSVETVRLWENGSRLRSALYAAGTLACCLLAMGLAWGALEIM